MGERSSFFNSIKGDRRYQAEDWAEFFASFIGNGVFPSPSTGLQITAGSGMEVIINPGRGWINGYFYICEAPVRIPLGIADGVLRRIERIVLRWDLTGRYIVGHNKRGTPEISPTPPPLERGADAYELALADVMVNNGATQITQANITDQRFNTELCGIVTGTVQQMDFDVLTAQFDAFFTEFKGTSLDDFTEWFDTIRDILDEEAAGKIMMRLPIVSQNMPGAQADGALWFDISGGNVPAALGNVHIGENPPTGDDFDVWIDTTETGIK